jgi:hypothetical protein
MKTQNNHLNKWLQTLLVVVCVVLVIVLLDEVNRDYSTISDTANASLASQSLTILGIEANDSFAGIDAYEEIIHRPLFNDDRKPYVYVEPAVQAKPPVKTKERPAPLSKPQQQLSLTAVVITPETSLAILQAGNTKTLQRVRLGETIDGWTLAEIQEQAIVLKQGEQVQTLELEIKGSSKTQRPSLAQKPLEETPQTTPDTKDDSTYPGPVSATVSTGSPGEGEETEP